MFLFLGNFLREKRFFLFRHINFNVDTRQPLHWKSRLKKDSKFGQYKWRCGVNNHLRAITTN